MSILNNPPNRDDLDQLKFAHTFIKDKISEARSEVDILALKIASEVLSRAITDAYWSGDSR